MRCTIRSRTSGCRRYVHDAYHVTKEEAEQAIEFAHALAEFLFVLPAHIQKGFGKNDAAISILIIYPRMEFPNRPFDIVSNDIRYNIFAPVLVTPPIVIVAPSPLRHR